ncbi:CGNR zinc finger domain-containing protein [Leekyejoonella antrihumi]|uniref:RNA-binding protein n=1 Tax=Leekyejoonella antrihumi TaxID=1660198 RepID=A0A563DU02_9MICO|nr:CGNR zinc finger domain-containing protein [Leekyejoonella antrihumi]TWP33656.1 RNA-binding protein [Leekyejoonella antrihumi]
MLFTHDTDVALAALAALVNTEKGEPDPLADPAGLDAFVDEWGWTGRRRHDEQERREVVRVRSRLVALWGATEDETVTLVNDLLRQAGAVPQLVRHDQWDYHLHATSAEAPLATRMAVEAAMAMVDVVRAGELGRLRWCTADDCDNVMVDLSKNRSRRYCDGGCGNRANVAAYRARQASGTG